MELLTLKKEGFFYVLLYYLGVRYVLIFFYCSKPHNVFCAAVHTSENLKKKSKTKNNGFLFYIHLNCVSRGVGKARHLISVVIVACIHYSPLPLLSLSSV